MAVSTGNPFFPNAALEAAVVNAILTAAAPTMPDGTIAPPYSKDNCRRMFDAQPWPGYFGKPFVSVWSDNGRQSNMRTCLDETYHLFVTITLRASGQMHDQWLALRDEMEARHDAIRALIHQDSWDFSVTSVANTYANLTWKSTDTVRHVGFAEALAYDGSDPIQEVGANWFGANIQTPQIGIAQKLRFGKARRIQRFGTLQ